MEGFEQCLTKPDFIFFFLVKKLIYLFNWSLITILWFLPYINMNQPWVYMCHPLSFIYLFIFILIFLNFILFLNFT